MRKRLAELVEWTAAAELDVRMLIQRHEIELQLGRRQLDDRDDVFLCRHNPGADIARQMHKADLRRAA